MLFYYTNNTIIEKVYSTNVLCVYSNFKPSLSDNFEQNANEYQRV